MAVHAPYLGYDNDSFIFGPFVLLIHLLLLKPLKYYLDLKAVCKARRKYALHT